MERMGFVMTKDAKTAKIGMTSPKCTRLKDRDYDVTPRIILILSLTCTPKCTRGRRRFARCSVDMVGEECEVYCEDGRRRVGGGPWVGAR